MLCRRLYTNYTLSSFTLLPSACHTLSSSFSSLSLSRNSPLLSQTLPHLLLLPCFYIYISNRVAILRLKISSNPSLMPPHFNPPLTPKVLSSFLPVSVNEIAKLLYVSPNKQCNFDPIPTFLLKQVLPIITTIVNHSLSCDTFLIHLKQTLVTQLIKKHPLIKMH